MDDQKARWEAEQTALQSRVVLSGVKLDDIRHVGGVDISFVKGSEVHACAAFIVLSFPALEIVHREVEYVRLTQPYISGFLAFREAPLLIPLISRVRANHPELFPDVVLVDGNGVLHPRAFGLACHLGVVCDLPVLGVAKSFLNVDGLEERQVKEAAAASIAEQWGEMELKGASGVVHGKAMRVTAGAEGFKPIYVSAGHKIDLDTACAVVRRCCKFRVPEPVRQADLLSREFLRNHPPPADDHAPGAVPQDGEGERN